MSNRHLDWLRQAEADLASAATSLKGGHYEWACFAAQQGAEKAVKALYLKRGADAWGHTITPLLGGLTGSDVADESLITCAKILDKHYIPTRYPSGLDSGAPADFYTRQEADTAHEYARRIVDFCARAIQGP
jgi:HEPN domain-containing protein